MFAGQGSGFAQFGIGLGDMRTAVVNGWQFSQRSPVPADEARAREPIAQASIEGRRWREVIDRWFAVERPAIQAAVAEVVVVDPTTLEDDGLLGHIEDVQQLMYRAADHHFEHISLFAIVGELVLECRGWGIRAEDAVSLLRGASPASDEAARSLRPVIEALRSAGVRPASLDDVRSASPAARAGLEAHLHTFGLRLVGGFDVCDVSLAEVPETVLATIVSALDSPADRDADDDADIRAAVPAGDRARFDDLLAAARACYGVRDDDVAPLMTARGAYRRALVAVGSRWSLADPAHVFEADFHEIVEGLAGGSRPTPEELEERAALRERQAVAIVPPFLGDPPEPPDLSNLPPAVRRLTEGFLAYGQLMFQAGRQHMQGFGVGTRTVRGRARVVHRAEEALSDLEPGDILVTSMTTPAFNAVLPLAGALATQEGGLLSHAGIIARELDIPAAIGVGGLLSSVVDGDEIEVDAAAGTVTIIAAR
ncbi:MAG TPA: PEP-utilizing enzyme [Acidimicrobiales bacterium]|nr:PEP-utilizing enzyme [Acidimicrobiales bacterium]